MANMYFSAVEDSDWYNANNWFTDGGLTTPALGIPQDGDNIFLMGATFPTTVSAGSQLVFNFNNFDTSGCTGAGSDAQWSTGCGLTGNLILGIAGNNSTAHYWANVSPAIQGNVTVQGGGNFYLDNDVYGDLVINDNGLYSGAGTIRSITVNDNGTLQSQPTSLGAIIFNGGSVGASATVTAPLIIVYVANFSPSISSVQFIGNILLLGSGFLDGTLAYTVTGWVASDCVEQSGGLGYGVKVFTPRVSGTSAYILGLGINGSSILGMI